MGGFTLTFNFGKVCHDEAPRRGCMCVCLCVWSLHFHGLHNQLTLEEPWTPPGNGPHPQHSSFTGKTHWLVKSVIFPPFTYRELFDTLPKAVLASLWISPLWGTVPLIHAIIPSQFKTKHANKQTWLTKAFHPIMGYFLKITEFNF